MKCGKDRPLFFAPLSLTYAHQKTAKTSGRKRDREGSGVQGKKRKTSELNPSMYTYIKFKILEN